MPAISPPFLRMLIPCLAPLPEAGSGADRPQWVETVEIPAGEGLRPRFPLHAAASIASPVLLVQGKRVTRVPVEQRLLVQQAMQAAGRKVGVEFLEDADRRPGGLETLGPAQRLLARQLCARGRRPVPQGCARLLEYARPLE